MTPKALLHGASRKAAKDAKFGEDRKIFFFAGLASWREKLCGARSVEHSIGKNLTSSLFQVAQLFIGMVGVIDGVEEVQIGFHATHPYDRLP